MLLVRHSSEIACTISPFMVGFIVTFLLVKSRAFLPICCWLESKFQLVDPDIAFVFPIASQFLVIFKG